MDEAAVKANERSEKEAAAQLKALQSCYLGKDQDISRNAVALIEALAAKTPLTRISSESHTLNRWNTKLSSLLQSSNASSRWLGAQLVKQTVTQAWHCLASHGSTWLQLLIGIVQNPEPTVTLERAIDAILCIVQRTKDLTKNAEIRISVFDALHKLMLQHPTTFRPASHKINTATISLLDQMSPSSREELLSAGKCYGSLYCVTSKRDSQHRFNDRITPLITEMQSCLDSCFRFVEDERRREQSNNNLGLQPLPDKFEAAMPRILDRFDRLSVFLEATLCQNTQTTEIIQVGQIVDVITRILQVQPTAMLSDDVDMIDQSLLFSYLSSFHARANNLLQVLAKSIGQAIAPHLSQYFELILACLRHERDDRLFLQSCFDAYATVLTVMPHSCANKSLAVLIDSSCRLLSEVVPEHSVSEQTKVTGSSKKRRKLDQTSSGTADAILNASAFHQSPMESQLFSCLDFIQACLEYNNEPLRTQNERAPIEDALLSASLHLKFSSDGQVSTSLKTRIDDLLMASSLAPRLNHAAVVPQTISALSCDRSVGSTDFLAKQHCLESLGAFDAIIHPLLPSLPASDINMVAPPSERNADARPTEEPFAQPWQGDVGISSPPPAFKSFAQGSPVPDGKSSAFVHDAFNAKSNLGPPDEASFVSDSAKPGESPVSPNIHVSPLKRGAHVLTDNSPSPPNENEHKHDEDRSNVIDALGGVTEHAVLPEHEVVESIHDGRDRPGVGWIEPGLTEKEYHISERPESGANAAAAEDDQLPKDDPLGTEQKDDHPEPIVREETVTTLAGDADAPTKVTTEAEAVINPEPGAMAVEATQVVEEIADNDWKGAIPDVGSDDEPIPQLDMEWSSEEQDEDDK